MAFGVEKTSYFTNTPKGMFSKGIPIQVWVCTTCGYLQQGVQAEELAKQIKK